MRTEAFRADMHEAMARMTRAMHEAPHSGDPDRDFLVMMIPHHQGAVDMAQLVLRHGLDPLTRQLAEQMLAGQTLEIASMEGRLLRLAAPEEFPALGGLRSKPTPAP